MTFHLSQYGERNGKKRQRNGVSLYRFVTEALCFLKWYLGYGNLFGVAANEFDGLAFFFCNRLWLGKTVDWIVPSGWSACKDQISSTYGSLFGSPDRCGKLEFHSVLLKWTGYRTECWQLPKICIRIVYGYRRQQQTSHCNGFSQDNVIAASLRSSCRKQYERWLDQFHVAGTMCQMPLNTRNRMLGFLLSVESFTIAV